MLGLLRLVSWRHVMRHRLRTLLTFLGVVLGVAVIVAIALVNRTLTGSFQRTIDLIAGRAVLQVENGESGFTEALFPAIRDTPGVADAAPAVEGFLPLVGAKGEKLYVYGVDFLADSAIRDHEFAGGPVTLEAALDFIARPDSIALTETFSRRLSLPLGARLRLATSRGVRDYTVRALLKEQGAAKVFGGSFALMDLPAAQIALGKDGKLDIVDLTIDPGETVETVRARLQARVGGAAQAVRPRERGEQVESLMTSFRVGLFFVSLVALFVGFFLIFNTVSVSVIQRKREIGTLRCLGILRRQILYLFVLEALALAVTGSIAGIVAGFVLAQAALYSVGQTVNSLFFQFDATYRGAGFAEIAVGLAGGVGISLAAAFYPAWQAASVAPLESSRQAVWRPRASGVSRATLIGILLLLLAPALALVRPADFTGVGRFTLGVVAMMLFLLGLSFLAPLIVSAWAGLFWRALGRLPRRAGFLRNEARLACDSLRRAPGRSGMTVATLMISLAAIFTVAAFVASVRESLLHWVDRMVTADLVVHAGAKTAGPLNVPLREEFGAKLESIPGVAVVDYYRLIRSNYQGRPIMIESFSAERSARVRTLPMISGDGRTALEDLAAQKGALVSESFERKFGKHKGDSIRLPTPSGFVDVGIIGVYVDYSSDSGSVLIERSLYKRFWRDDLVDAFDLWLAQDADPERVTAAINQRYADEYQLFVSTHRELKANVVRLMEQSFSVNYAVEIVAVVVAIFSVVNTLLASVLDRTREIGVLRAIGATRKQLRGTVMAEAGWIGILGGTLGLIAGAIISYHHVVYNTRFLTGWSFQYYYPTDVAVLSLAASFALCLVAGYVPAKRAATIPIVAAIGYE
ncbi:MAG TPA: FtsX-like permease family protein [Verrucomicrobiae bacterium]|jgi:putative ABC transport system permease protein|nr:FtsX-like permease family protein [Verrucomicrobiae bacterium]